VVRILPSEAQDVGKEEDRGAGVRAWDMGYGLLLARYPVFLAIYRLKENVCHSLVMRRKKNKAMYG
jgi:hypothetical protein